MSVETRRRYSSSSSSTQSTAADPGGAESESFATRAARHYQIHDRALQGITPPIVLASTYLLDDAAHSTRLADKAEVGKTCARASV